MGSLILAVSDVVEVIASHLPYPPGLGIDPALAGMEKNGGIFYDSAVTGARLRLLPGKRF